MNQRAPPSPGWSAIGAMVGIEIVLITVLLSLHTQGSMEMRQYGKPPNLSILVAQS